MVASIMQTENFYFFQKWPIVLGNFESYLSLLKSPEFMPLIVLKHVYIAPALPPSTEYSAVRQFLSNHFVGSNSYFATQ